MYVKFRKIMLVLVLVLASCAPAAVPMPTPTPTPTPFPENFIGKATIDDYELSISCAGSGEPTVILERGPYQDKGWTRSDLERFAKITRTCYYDHAGTSTGKVFMQPRTAKDYVNDVHDLVTQNEIPGPYIFATFYTSSYNGMLYADQYPEDVAGLVLVSTYYPTFVDYWLKKMEKLVAAGDEDAKKYTQHLQNYKLKTVANWNKHLDRYDEQDSGDQVLTVTSLKDIPVTILFPEIWFSPESISEAFLHLHNEAIKESLTDVCKLTSNCQVLTFPNLEFTGIVADPVVDQALQEMVDLVRGE